MTMEKADLFVIGGGSGGVRAARLASERGAKVVLAEAGRLGGTCVNLGCVPKKLLVYATDYGHFFHDAPGYGWQTDGKKLELDWNSLRDRKDKEIRRLNGIYQANLEKAGVALVAERASLTDASTVEADGTVYECKNILIATGGRPVKPNIPGYAEFASVSDDIFSLPHLPERVAVAGAGYIAVEFCCILAGLGCKVSLLHRGPTVLKNFDVSIQKALLAEMERLGVELRLDSPVERLEKDGDQLSATFAGGERHNCDMFLAATGRGPNVEGLGLGKAGVETRSNGAVIVDEDYATNVPGVYAVGDVTGRVQLTPVAIAEAMSFVAKQFGGYGPDIDYGKIPTAVFTHPSVGTCGMTEQQAKEKYPDCETHVSEFTPFRHSLTGTGEKSMLKLIWEKGNGRVLGVHMVGPEAGEIMQGFAVALATDATKLDFDAVVGIHPTTAEEFVSMR